MSEIAHVKAACRIVAGDKVLTVDGWREVGEVSFGNYACGEGVWWEKQNNNPFSWPPADVALEPDDQIVVM